MYPFIHLAEGLELPTFFLIISAVISLSLFWLVQRAPRYAIPVSQALDLSLVLMIASLLGARLFHVLYENPEYYQQDPKKIFYLWEGGFVFFGGAIAAFLAGVATLKILKIKPWGPVFDLFAPVFAFSYGLGRLGCFFAGCCYGKACDLPWAVSGRHPTQLYALLWELGSLMILLGVEATPFAKRPPFLSRSGDVFLLWVTLHAGGRLMMESYRDDFRGNDILGISVSSFFSIVLIVVGFLFLAGKKKPHGKL